MTQPRATRLMCNLARPRWAVTAPITLGLTGRADARITVRSGHGISEQATVADLAGSAVSLAHDLAKSGMEPGEPLAVALPTGLDVVIAILAAWALRSPVCLLPSHRRHSPTFHHQFSASLAHVRPGALLVSEDYIATTSVERFRPPILKSIKSGSLAGYPLSGPFPHPQPDDIAILQLTSGSTATPRAVPIRHHHLAANLKGLGSRAQIEARDVLVSWMPLFHDAGLSILMQALAFGIDLVLVPTEAFSVNPLIWLAAIQESAGTVTPATPSALRLLCRMKNRARRSRLSLSTVRYMWVGAEPVFPSDLANFEEAFGPLGLRERVLQPAYGLAESVVAVSAGAAHHPRRELFLARDALRQGRVVPVSDQRAGLCLVSNGTPIEGATVVVRRSDGSRSLPDEVGELFVSGPSVPGHYLGTGPATMQGEVATGDLGFIYDEEVFVTGRRKDVIIRGGVNFAPEAIERCAENLWHLRPGSAIAFSHVDHVGQRERVVLLIDRRVGLDIDSATAQLSAQLAREVGIQVDDVIFVPASDLPKTTSGKVQRSAARVAYLVRRAREREERDASK